MFSVAGDSMIFVDKRGRRVVNEKLPYNELAQTFFQLGPAARRVPLPGADPGLGPAHPGALGQRRVRPADRRAPGPTTRTCIRGDDAGRAGRRRRASGSRATRRHRRAALADDFAANLGASIARFNELAATGVDDDFGRGERAVQQLFNGDVKEEPGRANPTMWPLGDTGPYYAALVTGGTLDTKGGPKADARRPGRRRPGPADPGPLRRRQLRRLRLGAGLLGRRGHARPDHRLRLPRGEPPREPGSQSARRSHAWR